MTIAPRHSIIGGTFVVLGILPALFSMMVPKASAQTPITGIHGAFGAGITLLVPSEGDTTMQWKLRQMDLVVRPRISPEVGATIVLAFAKFVDGPVDPVLVASIDWKPSERFELTGGRILNPVGLSRWLPPHKLIELTYAETGITAPFIEHGVMGTWRPSQMLEFGAGIVSGHGTSGESDFKPDGILLARIKPVDGFTLGLDFQTGKQDAGWRHVLGLHLKGEVGMFFGQAEVVANFDAGDDRPTIGWYFLSVLRPTPEWEPYVRIEWLHDLRDGAQRHDSIGMLGVNYRPTTNTALRAAATAPLASSPTIGLQFVGQVSF